MGLITKDGDLHYYPIGDKYVCADCFDDEYLKEFVEGQAESPRCDYCRKISTDLIAANIDDVIEYIHDCISTEWGNPDDEVVPVEDGEYVFPVTNSFKLFSDEIELNANPNVLEAIMQAFRDELWVKKDYRTAEVMLSGWALFVDEIKHHRRYFFNLDENEHFFFDIQPSKFLDRLGKEISDLELVSTLTTSDTVYRARIHDPKITLSKAAELGPPSPEFAIYSNRMSPAGISMFYGSFDIDTTIKETCKVKKDKPSTVTIGKFKPLRELKLLNLTSLPDVPSIFDDHRSHLRSTIIFLRAFVEDLSKPIEQDDKLHIEYVPTQVFTEYIRHAYKFEDGSKFDGILYRSSVNPLGISCVLFVENDDCCDKGAEREWKHYLLVLESTEKMSIT